jgi:hypothetical protein
LMSLVSWYVIASSRKTGIISLVARKTKDHHA